MEWGTTGPDKPHQLPLVLITNQIGKTSTEKSRKPSKAALKIDYDWLNNPVKPQGVKTVINYLISHKKLINNRVKALIHFNYLQKFFFAGWGILCGFLKNDIFIRRHHRYYTQLLNKYTSIFNCCINMYNVSWIKAILT